MRSFLLSSEYVINSKARLGQSIENYPKHLGLRKLSRPSDNQKFNKEVGEWGVVGKGTDKSKVLGYVAGERLICKYPLFYLLRTLDGRVNFLEDIFNFRILEL